MAKWKNIALISTIVAPIAFGVGDAFAQANRPGDEGTTVVLHKRETVGAEGAGKDAENLYWGDGNLDTSGAFDNWKWEAGVTFTAFDLGNIISLDENGKPKIATQDVPGTDGKYKWNQVLTAVEGSTAPVKQGNADDKNQYAIEFVDQPNFDATDLRAALEKAKVETKSFGATNDKGETTQNLENGNWIILEDIKNGTQPSDSIETFATPMIISLPMLNAKTQDGKTNWFGTDTDSELNLYPKNYTDTGNLRLVKTDGQTKAAIKGATIAIMQLTDAKKAELETAISKGLLSGKVATIESELSKYATEGSLKYDVIENAEQGVVFNNLVPGQTYYVLEIAAPNGYLPNGKLQQATLNRASLATGDETIGTDTQDVTVDHRGGKYELKNYDTPTLDKDINVLKPAAVTDLVVNGYDADNNPIYDNKNADYSQTFVDNDTQFGVSRGKAYNYTVDLETNPDLGTYSKFGIVDNIPYQVNINSWTLYGRFGKGGVTTLADNNQGLVPLIQAVDPDGDTPDHSTSDGLHQPSKPYDADKGTGVSFKFYDQAAANAFDYPGKVYAEGDPNYKQSLIDQTKWIAEHLIHMYRYNSQYSFDAKNQAVQFDATGDGALKNGKMTIDFSKEFLTKYSSTNKFETLTQDQGVSSSLVFKMNAQTNSAAQANVGGTNKGITDGEKPQTNMINNFVTFNYNNGYVGGSMYDQSQTNAVGWEFQKTDSKGNPVSGAGFDLGRLVTKENVENVISQLIGNKNNGNVVSDETKLHMADKMGFTGNDAAKITQVTNYLNGQADVLRKAVADGSETFVWFIHLTAAADASGNKQPIVDAMDSHMEMGDIYWVTDKRWATTHLSGTDRGYFQYCGVADGNYVLHEEITPKGYKQMDDLKFTIGANDSFYVDANGKSKNAEYPTVTSAGDNQQMPSDNQITGRVGEDATAEDNWASIKNYKKSVLPVVGGVGALSLFFIGAIAMIASYIKRKTEMREN